MHDWQSKPIAVDGIAISVHANTRGVILGRVLDGVYASDLLLTPDQARSLACALIEGADKADAARGEA